MTQNQGEMREAHPSPGESYRFRMDEDGGEFTFHLEDGDSTDLLASISLSIESGPGGEGLCRAESGRTHRFAWARVGAELHLWLDGALYVFQEVDRSGRSGRRRGAAGAESAEDILAPMPGTVLEVLVGEGDRVARNQTVALMESMKMELVITASRNGIVRRVAVEPGQQVERGMRLMELAPASDDSP